MHRIRMVMLLLPKVSMVEGERRGVLVLTAGGGASPSPTKKALLVEKEREKKSEEGFKKTEEVRNKEDEHQIVV